MDHITQAERFVHEHGRDIDAALFDFHFAGGTRSAVLEALSPYQNDDGGFGHGLEPDIGAAVSNPFATELALSICLDVGVHRDHLLLSRAVAYLEATQDEEGNWRFSPEIYEDQIAPWFAGWTWPNLNPSCTIAGLLEALGVGSEQLHERVGSLFEQLSDPADLLGNRYYAVRPYAFYFRASPANSERDLYLSGVAWWLIRERAAGNLPDALHFFEYVRDPASEVARLLPAHMVEEQLDRMEAEQAEDGGWPVAYGEHWRAPSTVANLLVLKRFGRISPASQATREAQI